MPAISSAGQLAAPINKNSSRSKGVGSPVKQPVSSRIPTLYFGVQRRSARVAES